MLRGGDGDRAGVSPSDASAHVGPGRRTRPASGTARACMRSPASSAAATAGRRCTFPAPRGASCAGAADRRRGARRRRSWPRRPSANSASTSGGCCCPRAPRDGSSRRTTRRGLRWPSGTVSGSPRGAALAARRPLPARRHQAGRVRGAPIGTQGSACGHERGRCTRAARDAREPAPLPALCRCCLGGSRQRPAQPIGSSALRVDHGKGRPPRSAAAARRVPAVLRPGRAADNRG
jgi:hypothetical protein